MTFPRGPGTRSPLSGRKPGTENKSTNLTRQNVRSALEILREDGKRGPIELMVDGARFLSSIGALISKPDGRFKDEAGNVITDEMRHLAAMAKQDPKTFDRMLDCVWKGIQAAALCAPFAYPRLASMEFVGDAPTTKVENTYVFQLETGEPGEQAVEDSAEDALDLEALEDDGAPRN